MLTMLKLDLTKVELKQENVKNAQCPRTSSSRRNNDDEKLHNKTFKGAQCSGEM